MNAMNAYGGNNQAFFNDQYSKFMQEMNNLPEEEEPAIQYEEYKNPYLQHNSSS